mmetsp:Transcript_69074/g.202225  ORF Transcript_69074/g.202225 Transcript_69074/m.202225 type:complete len:256 (-) Transcript_69074:1097-1864(-)
MERPPMEPARDLQPERKGPGLEARTPVKLMFLRTTVKFCTWAVAAGLLQPDQHTEPSRWFPSAESEAMVALPRRGTCRMLPLPERAPPCEVDSAKGTKARSVTAPLWPSAEPTTATRRRLAVGEQEPLGAALGGPLAGPSPAATATSGPVSRVTTPVGPCQCELSRQRRRPSDRDLTTAFWALRLGASDRDLATSCFASAPSPSCTSSIERSFILRAAASSTALLASSSTLRRRSPSPRGRAAATAASAAARWKW